MPVRVPLPALAAGERILSAETSRYLVRVLRLGTGEHVLLFDPDARTEADAEIVDAQPHSTRVLVGNVRTASVVAGAKLALVYALAKGDKVDAVVRDATELGATHVVLCRTARSVVKLDNASERLSSKIERWKRIAEQAARQCGRADPPAIEGVLDWAEALERMRDCEARFCLDPRADDVLGSYLSEATQHRASIAFAVGPEGGLSTEEVQTAASIGFRPASLGPFVLRTETVAAAILGAVRILSPPLQDALRHESGR